MRTPAERHSWLVEQGVTEFIETFLKLFKHESEGGRTPGVEVPTRSELRKLFEQTTPEYWLTLPPNEAQSQLEQWKTVE